MTYFTPIELEQLRQLEDQQIETVLYTVWKNLANPDGTFEVLEWVELMLGDGRIIGFSTDEDHEGLRVGQLDFDAEKARVQMQFRGQVSLERIDMGPSPTWQTLIGQRITGVGLLPPEGGSYSNRMIQLLFPGNILELALNQEGLLVTRGKR